MSDKISENAQPVVPPVTMKDSHFEFLPYLYAGIAGGEAACYMRCSIKDSRCLVLVSQLPNYFGTDITSGFSEIVKSLANYLLDQGIICIETSPRKPFLQRLKDTLRPLAAQEREAELNKAVAVEVLRKSMWVACYPPGVGLSSAESFALVRMDSDLIHRFDYRRKNVIAEFLNVSECDLDVDYDRLHSAVEAFD